MRAADIDRITKAAAQVLDNGPICLLLIARSAGDWWKELCADCRHVQLVFESEPITRHGNDLPVADREKFFKRAAAAFYLKLKGDGADDVASALINQARGLMHMGATKRAKERLEQAGAIYRKIEEVGYIRFPWMLGNLRALEEALRGN
ncbi:MAG TPA: hypothetical protein VF708_13250 [Pyrinomonadaceae bacterium]|jgi:hypothetical protein